MRGSVGPNVNQRREGQCTSDEQSVRLDKGVASCDRTPTGRSRRSMLWKITLFRSVEAAQFARTRRICSFIRAIRQDESPRRTVQYPLFGGKRPDFGSLIASGLDPSGTSELGCSALRPYCQRVHGQRSLLAALGQNSTGAPVPSLPNVRLLRTYPDIGAQTP